MNVSFDPQLTDDERRHRIFDGHLILYSSRVSTKALCHHAKAMIDDAFGALDPETAQDHLSVEEFVAIVGPLKTRFTNDDRTKALLRNVLDDYGCDRDQTSFDVPRLRVVTHSGYLSAGVGYVYKAHRDVWYSSPHSQLNWWAPVFDVTPERSMGMFPSYWNRPIANTSADFDYDEWCRVGRQQAASQVDVDTRKHPLPSETVKGDPMCMGLGVGTILIFSSAHLHATMPNTSGKTRFSVDFRTVNEEDVRAGRGAPNVDCRALGTTLGDFLRASDLSHRPLDPVGVE
jgi:hypothetical protein